MWDLMQQLGEQTLPELFSRSLFVLKNKTVMNFFFFLYETEFTCGSLISASWYCHRWVLYLAYVTRVNSHLARKKDHEDSLKINLLTRVSQDNTVQPQSLLGRHWARILPSQPSSLVKISYSILGQEGQFSFPGHLGRYLSYSPKGFGLPWHLCLQW